MRSLFLALSVITICVPASASIAYQRFNDFAQIMDEGYGVEQAVNLPAFNPALGPLVSVDYSAVFNGAVSSSDASGSYTGNVDPYLQIRGPIGAELGL